jgi:single-stranded DNA-binding protein
MKSFPAMAKAMLLFLALAAGGTVWAAGRSAEDYLHGGGGKYIQGRLQEATVEVEEGLSHYPKDSRLKSLADQLKKMQDQKKKDQGGSGSQGGENPNQKQDKKDSSSQDSQSKKDQEQKDKEKQKEKDQQQAKDEKKDKDAGKQDQQDKDKGDKDKGDSSGQAAAPAKPGQMSKEEAERLLNSYQDDEKREHQQMQHRQRKPVEVEKDW